jgi:hypothetical protein
MGIPLETTTSITKEVPNSKYIDLGKTKKLLGMEVTQNENGSVTISQKNHILELLKCFNMENSHSQATPIVRTTQDTSEPFANYI